MIAVRGARKVRWLAPGLQLLLITIGTAPLWSPELPSAPGSRPVAALLERWFAFQCARDPARVFALLGPSPVCARCTGLYLGFAAGALLARPLLHAASLRIWLVAASALMLLDVLSEAWGFRPAWASLRFATGSLLAYPVGVALVLAVRDRTRDRATAESRSPRSAPSTSD